MTEPPTSPNPSDPEYHPATETSWMAPDPPPIPDRILKKVSPRKASRPKLPPMPRVRMDKRLVLRSVLCGVALVLGVVAWLCWPSNEFDVESRKRWVKLCTDYAGWYEDFGNDLTHADQLALKDFGLLDVLLDVGIAAYDPRVIADQPDADLAHLSEHPPRGVKSEAGLSATRAAEAGLERVKAVFQQWPVLVQLREHQRVLSERGWDRAVALIQTTAANAPPYGATPVAEALHDVADVEAETGVIATALINLDITRQALEADEVQKDPVLTAFVDEVDRLSDQSLADAPDPTKRLEQLAQDAEALNAFGERIRATIQRPDWARIDLKEFQSNGKAYALLDDPQTPRQRVFRDWLEEVSEFQRVGDDWRQAWAGQQRAKVLQINQTIQSLKEADHPTYAPMSKQLQRLESRLDALLEKPLVEGNAGELEVQRFELERAVSDLARSTDQIASQVAALDAAEDLRRRQHLGSETIRSAAVDERWRIERDRLAQRVERDGDLDRLQRDLRAVEKHLLALIDPDRPTALPSAIQFPLDDADKVTARFVTALNDYAKQDREDTLTEALQGTLPVEPDRWRDLRGRFTKHHQEMRELVDAAQTIQRVYGGAYPLDAPEAMINGSTLTEMLEGWSKLSPMRDAAVAKTGKPVLDRVNAVDAVGRLDQWKVLAQMALEADQPALGFAVWRQMDKVAWPGGGTALDIELKIQSHLRRLADGINDPGRRATLIAGFSDARRQRWSRAMASSRDASEVQEVASRVEAMSVALNTVSPSARYNVMLFGLRRAVADLAEAPDRGEQVRLLAEAFAQQLSSQADTPATLQPLIGALNSLTHRNAKDRERLDEAGPAQAGWAWQRLDGGQRVVFTLDGQSLEFVRFVPHNNPAEAFYLCTTELAVGVAIRTVERANAWDTFLGLLPAYHEGEDPRKGPRSWLYDSDSGRRAIRSNNSDWLAGQTDYPNGFTVDAPSAGQPINYVNAASGVFLANLLGCELPTIVQWRAAHDGFPVQRGEMPNLRDLTWARYAVHTAQRIESGVRDVAWADSDVFLPEGYVPPADHTVDHHPVNDGVLWFEANPDASVPQPIQLVGNVAELVTTSTVKSDTLLGPVDQSLAERLVAFRVAHKSDFAVIGCSSLSPTAFRPDQPQPLNLFIGANGYADVGLRLAFTAPRATPAQQIDALIDEQDYLFTK